LIRTWNEGGKHCETYIPAQQSEKKKNARVPQKNGYTGWPPGSEKKTLKRQKEIVCITLE